MEKRDKPWKMLIIVSRTRETGQEHAGAETRVGDADTGYTVGDADTGNKQCRYLSPSSRFFFIV